MALLYLQLEGGGKLLLEDGGALLLSQGTAVHGVDGLRAAPFKPGLAK